MVSKRTTFSGKFGFIAAAAGSAVGLGNIWKFPFEAGKSGGSAFLLMYLIFCFVLCFPIMATEIAIGRRSQKSAALAFRPLGYPNWSFVGALGVFCGVLILSFYNVVAAWVVGYFVEMLIGNFGIGKQFSTYTSDIPLISGYALAFMFATAFIVAQGITKGIEKASKIMMPLLLGIIVALAAYALTLPGAAEGLRFYLVPDLSKINLSVIYRALGQAFFSLSLGLGAMMTFGSYLSKKEDIISSSALITLADLGIAFLAGLMIFPMVFSQGLSVEGGAGLIFITMPGVFESMGPVLGVVVGSLFFLLLAFAALTSTISLLELPVAFLVDKFHIQRKVRRLVCRRIGATAGHPLHAGRRLFALFHQLYPVCRPRCPGRFYDLRDGCGLQHPFASRGLARIGLCRVYLETEAPFYRAVARKSGIQPQLAGQIRRIHPAVHCSGGTRADLHCNGARDFFWRYPHALSTPHTTAGWPARRRT
jgi:neurotransmitter:Na+ symporter, NSS family